jgi:hypothetical protein
MDSTQEERSPEFWRIAAKWAVFIAVVAGVYLSGSWLIVVIESQFMPWYDAYGEMAIAMVVVLYVVLMALPFVPGIEISLALLMIFGMEGVGIVYGSTLAALILGFLAGKLVPLVWMARLMAWLHYSARRAPGRTPGAPRGRGQVPPAGGCSPLAIHFLSSAPPLPGRGRRLQHPRQRPHRGRGRHRARGGHERSLSPSRLHPHGGYRHFAHSPVHAGQGLVLAGRLAAKKQTKKSTR